MSGAPSIRILPAWQREDFALETAAIKFWRQHELLPARVDERARSRSLSAIAYADDEVAGVSTIIVRLLPMVRARIAMFRCSVAPEHRRLGLAAQLAVTSRDLVEVWSRDNPAREVLGMGCVVQGAELSEKKEQPVWPISGMGLVGYNLRGEQIRVVWFRHAKLT